MPEAQVTGFGRPRLNTVRRATQKGKKKSAEVRLPGGDDPCEFERCLRGFYVNYRHFTIRACPHHVHFCRIACWNWLATVEDKRGRYFPERTAVVLEQFRSIGLLSPVVAPTLSQAGGAVPFGFELLLDAPQGDVWVTTDGSDPRLPGGAPSAAAKRVRSLVLEASTRVRARALVGDTWSPLVEADFVVAPSDAGGQRPGDANGDAAVNVADVIALLGNLVLGEAPRLPCGDGSLRALANRTLLDSNTDGWVDLADALYILDFLFRSGPAPGSGERCVLLAGCPRSCAE